jgi:hypothetical protein
MGVARNRGPLQVPGPSDAGDTKRMGGKLLAVKGEAFPGNAVQYELPAFFRRPCQRIRSPAPAGRRNDLTAAGRDHRGLQARHGGKGGDQTLTGEEGTIATYGFMLAYGLVPASSYLLPIARESMAAATWRGEAIIVRCRPGT